MTFQRPSNIKILSTNERLEEIFGQFELSPESARHILETFQEALESSIGPERHVDHELEWNKTPFSQLPTGKENGEFYTLSVSRGAICARHAKLEKGTILLSDDRTAVTTCIRNGNTMTIDILSPEFTASDFLGAAMESIQKLFTLKEQSPKSSHVEFVMSSSIPLDIESLDAAAFRWSRTNASFFLSQNEDPVVGINLIELLNVGLEREEINAVIIGACNEGTSVMIAGAYERLASMPRCLMGVHIGHRIDMTILQPNPMDFGLASPVLDINISGFTGAKRGCAEKSYAMLRCLPISPVDLEESSLDSPASNSPRTLLQQIMSFQCIPDTCRKLLIYAFQEQAPSTVWVPNSLSAESAMAILEDKSPPAKATEVLHACWQWRVTPAQAEIAHRLVVAAYSRSAALVAIFVVAVAKRTGRMQPALGGVTCGMSGDLGVEPFQELVRSHIASAFSMYKKTTVSIHLFPIKDAGPKGAAILNYMIRNHQI